MRRIWAAALAAVAALSFPTPAAAAENPYTYRVCGAGYNLVSGGALDVRTTGGALWGQLYVTYHGPSGQNCVVVIKRAYVATASETSVSISSPGSEGGGDRGRFEYYAGPVYEYAPGECISVSGRVWNPDRTANAFRSVSEKWCD